MIALARLTVEHAERPVGIDVAPRFGWIVDTDEQGVEQLGYRITVEGPGLEWATEWRDRPESVDVAYDGPALPPLARIRWRVEVRTTAGDARGESTFTTGVTDGDWRGARWIAHPTGDGAAPLLRTEFDLDAAPGHALLVVGAGGYADARLNGAPVDASVLSPGFTDYDVRTQYVVVDVTDRLTIGRNALGFELGRGFYGMCAANTWRWESSSWHAEPCVRAFLVADGVVVAATGGSWRAVDGPTRVDDLYGGETFDAAHRQPGWGEPGFDDSAWQEPTAVAGPRGAPEHQRQPPIEPVEHFEPDEVVERKPGVWVFTFPRVIAGWVEVDLDGPPGETVEITYGERLDEHGAPDNGDPLGYFAGRFQRDEVRLTGEPLTWHPRFGWKGFRYVQVTGWRPPVVRAVLVHTRADRIGHFSCSHPALTRIHDLTVDTVRNNLHGIPTDTPMYEKNGWTGDGMVGAELMLTNLDTHELLAKWVTDIADTRHGTGAPKVIAPHGAWGMDWSPAPTWHSALVLVPWWIHERTGDSRVLRDVWADAADYVRFELDRSPGGIASTTLGDWVSPETDAGGGNPPEDLRVAATAFLVAMLDTMARTAVVLGEDPGPWRDDADRVRAAFVREFFDADAGIVRGVDDAEYRQAHNVLALAFDLLPEAVRPAVAASIDADVRARGDHLSTGALATKFLLPVLTRYGYADTAFRVATQTTFPSWGYWLEHGATSLWEHWKLESRSRGHYFLGTIDDWLYADVAGLTPLEAGWSRIRIAPAVTHLLDWARASVLTPRGTVSVHWRRGPDGVELELSVPVGTVAEVELPGFAAPYGPGRHRIMA